nr:adenylate/guanylate cyclase domain-containing protein [Paracoccaceae bacterium]
MNTEIDRKIAVIFVADVVGYSKHMERNENATIKSYNACEKILNKLLKKYKGSVFNTAGDSVLAEFPSAVNAVECGVDFQNEIKKRNQSDKVDVKLEFRLGINMGDVVKKENNLIGDGVNIAARLEALAQPNGISISKSVYDFVVPKTKMSFNDLGIQKVKQNEFHAFDILLNPSQRRKLKTKTKSYMAIIGAIAAVVVSGLIVFSYLNLNSNNPISADNQTEIENQKILGRTLLISPFINKSGSDTYDYLSEGITDHLISSISSTVLLNIIPRQQSLIAKEKNYSFSQLREEMNVSFILDGSTYVSNNKFRINFELIGLEKNEILWSESKEFSLENFFDAQDEIEFLVRRILQSKLTMGEAYSSSIAKYFKDRTEYRTVLKLITEPYKDNFYVTEKYAEPFKLLMKRNPNNSFAHFLYAKALLKQQRAGKLAFKDYELMQNAIKKARELDPDNSAVYPVLASIGAWTMGMNIVEAQEYNLKGVKLGPDNFLTLFLAGSNFDVGRISDAISYLLRAKQIAPYGPNDVEAQLIRAYLYAKKQVTDSVSKAEKIAAEMMTHPEDYKVFWGNVYSVYIKARTKRIPEAKKILEKFLQQKELSIREVLRKIKNANYADKVFTNYICYILILTYDVNLLEELKSDLLIDDSEFDEERLKKLKKEFKVP